MLLLGASSLIRCLPLRGLDHRRGAVDGFFDVTPGLANQAGTLGLVNDTSFSADHGLYDTPFDVVITSLGWEYDRSVFTGGDVLPDLMGDPRRPNQTPYPSLTPEFESTNAPRMFFAGAATHGLDRYRYKASGGFIHGFRFNIRTLVSKRKGKVFNSFFATNLDSCFVFW